jgi:multicomponent Na+:H+ antiporter subunit E
MSLFLLNILLAIAWAALTGRFEPVNLVFGLGLGFVVLWFITPNRRSITYFIRSQRVMEFIFIFIFEIIKANIRLAITVLSPRMKLHPAVVAFPLSLKTEAGIIFLANLITLTPGTLSLDISGDRRVLFIHTIWLKDPEKFRLEIEQGFERRVMEILES